MRIQWFFLPALQLLVVSGLGAQVRLAGRVLDENNAAVTGARVTFARQTDGGNTAAAWQGMTGPSGAFSFVVREAGQYLAGVEREGYFRLRNRPVELREGPNEVVFVLNRLREVTESIDVSASPPGIDMDRTTSEEILTSNEILAIPYPTTNNLRNALRILPGVVQDTLGGVHISGGAEEQALYTLDGFNLNDPLTGRLESRLSVEAVRTMEVVTGRFSAEYGKGSAGTLTLHTTRGDDKFRYSGTNFIPGLEQHKGLIIGNWTPRFNFSGPLARGRAWFANSFDLQYDKTVIDELPDGADRTSSWRFSNLLSNQFNLSPSNILHTGFLVNYRFAPRTGLTALDPMETTVDRRSRQWFLFFKDQVYLSGGALLEFGYAANRTFGREIPQGPGLYLITPDGKLGNYFANAIRKGRRDQWLANVFLPSFGLAGNHRVKLGVDLDRVGYSQDVRRSGYLYYRADGTPRRRVTFDGSGRLGRNNFEAAWYAQDSWRPRPSLAFEAGVRQDWDRLTGALSISPRLGVAWSPPGLGETRLSGGYAVIHDATNLRLFTRPQDQYAVTTYLSPAGTIQRGPEITLYAIGGQPLASPRYTAWNLSVERRFPGDVFTHFRYLRKRGRDGFTYANVFDEGVAPGLATAVDPAYPVEAVYSLSNRRRDVYDSAEFGVRKNFSRQYEITASYVRSRALSNAVVDVASDDPRIITDNVGRLPWDAPNRYVSWGYLPTLWRNWSLAYLLEWRSGFPFSVEDDEGRVAGPINSRRFPAWFELNLHAERRFLFRGHYWAGRVGFNNITSHENPTVVNANAASPHFLVFYGSRDRSMNFRIRWLGKK